jgi:hypothetical protein
LRLLLLPLTLLPLPLLPLPLLPLPLLPLPLLPLPLLPLPLLLRLPFYYTQEKTLNIYCLSHLLCRRIQHR